MIPQHNLSRIANGLRKPRGRRVAEFLTGLPQHPLREFLAFKGLTFSEADLKAPRHERPGLVDN